MQDTGNILAGDHGTHVAGTIGAVNNNGIGVCGIAGGDKEKGIKGVRLMSCEIFEDYIDDNGDTQTTPGDIAKAAKYAADNGAVITQNSWTYSKATNNDISDIQKEVMDYFIKYAGIDENGVQTGPMKGGVIIFGSGNENITYCIPGSYEPVIAVAAIASDYEATYYTNYGDWVDISAPGGDSKKGYLICSTVPDNMYDLWWGTSMACPHVSGVAALIISYFGGPGFTNDMLKERLLNSANDIIYDYSDSKYTGLLGSGLVDANAAFNYKKENTAPVITCDTDSPFSIHSYENVKINFTISDSDNNSFTTSYNTGTDAATFSPDDLVLSIAGNKAEEGTYSFVLTATDEYGAKATYAFEYTILPNNPPTTTVNIDNIVLNGISGSRAITLDDYFTDIDGESLNYSIEQSNSDVADATILDGELKITPSEYGNTELTVTASDAKGESCSLTVNVLVRSDLKPVDIYPNPVSTFLSVRPGVIMNDVTITFTNTSGAQIKKINSDSVGPFSPVKIDLSGVAAGVYSVKVTSSDNNEFQSSIIKL